MSRIDSVMVKAFLYGLPILVLFGIFSYSYSTGGIDHTSGVARILNGLAGLAFAIWMTLSIVISIRLMLSASFRDQVLTRLTFIRERDERELMLTGKATRTIFLTTIAILTFLLCLSCFQVSIYRVPPEKAVDGKTGFVTLGFGMRLLEDAKPAVKDGDEFVKEDIFTYSGLPISSSAIILGLIFWQICSYNVTMRRLTNQP